MPKQFEHFIKAQNECWDSVLTELSNGKKETHWMWFVFPQIKGLTGSPSPTTIMYSLSSLEEAQSYYKDETLGNRLIKSVKLMIAVDDDDLNVILGFPDDLKFVSSMTLFSLAIPENDIFKDALRKYNNCNVDKKTLEVLNIKIETLNSHTIKKPQMKLSIIDRFLKFLKIK
jgi:uncharacterized protein (DUF1810 family)